MIYEAREDSYLLKEQVEKYAFGKVLDLGTGSGIQAEAALKNKAKVLAVDINEEAVNFVKKRGINARVSDLFSNINEKFDLIIFNPPYLPEIKEEKEVKRMVCGGKKGFEIIERFLKDARKYLNEDGKILIVFSSLTGDVLNLIRKYNFRFKLLSKKKLFFEEIYVYLIY